MTPSDPFKPLAWTHPLSKPPERKVKPVGASLKLLWEMLPAIIRISRWARKQKKAGMRPTFDLVRGGFPIEPNKGVPLGGLGGGTITRGCFGDFNRWQLQPGDYAYRNVPADQFSLWASREGEEPQAVVLNPISPETESLQSWGWGLEKSKVTYRALFPRAWHDYEDPLPGIRLSCRQISPVIPHNYKESSFPVSTFVWTVENTGETDADVALMFTFQNGTGGENDHAGGHSNHPLHEKARRNEVVGVQLHHIHRHPKPLEAGQSLAEQGQYEDPLTFAIGALQSKDVNVSYRTRFITDSSGVDVWGDFAFNGQLADDEDQRPSQDGFAIGGAVSAKVSVPAGETREIVFALVWDMPIARFPLGKGWYRRYTKFYGREAECRSQPAAGCPDALS